MVNRTVFRSQRGVYTIFSVFVIMMSLGAMGVLAVGHTAWEKARLQGIADMVALTAARQMANGPQFLEAIAIAQENGVVENDDMSIQCIIDNTPSADCANSITSRVTITRPVSSLLAFLPNRDVTVLAEATVAPTVVGSVSSGLLSVDTSQSALLNGLLTSLGGGSVNLTVAQWGSLLGSDIRVDLLKLSTQLGVANVNDLLSLNISALGLLEDALVVGNADEAEPGTFKDRVIIVRD